MKGRVSNAWKVPLTTVDSGAIASAGHDPEAGEIYLRFRSNPDLAYIYPCTAAEGAEFEGAASKGQFFREKIRGREFRKEPRSRKTKK